MVDLENLENIYLLDLFLLLLNTQTLILWNFLNESSFIYLTLIIELRRPNMRDSEQITRGCAFLTKHFQKGSSECKCPRRFMLLIVGC